jgi:hypothetical protein
LAQSKVAALTVCYSSTVTLFVFYYYGCTVDQYVHLIKYLSSQSFYTHFEVANDAFQLNCVNSACTWFNSASWNGISRSKNLYTLEYGRIFKRISPQCFLCAAQTLHHLAEQQILLMSFNGCNYCFQLMSVEVP